MKNEFLIEKLKESKYSESEIQNILYGLFDVKKKTTIRVNKLKSTYIEIANILDDLSIEYDEMDEYPDAFILKHYDSSRGQNIDTKTGLRILDFDFYKSGKIYVQSLSSMLPAFFLDPKPSDNILDMCAAPGSKTTMIQSIAGNKANVTAVELHNDRFEKLKHNIEMQGANVLCLNQNALDLNNLFKFDKILIDAPCSGSGTLEMGYEKYFTDKLISKCVDTQKKLIKKAAKLLTKDKMLVYSTCSLLKQENEDIIDFACKNGFILDKSRKILPSDIFEGFFVARLYKL